MKWMVLACIMLVVLAGIGEKTTHFNVKYDDSTSFRPGVGKVLEDAYRDVNDYLGNLPASIKVVMIDDEKMDDIGKHVEAFSAWNNRSSTIVMRDDSAGDKKSMGVVARHEICHLGLNEMLAKKDGHEFSWMEEGICMVISREPLDEVKVSKYILSQGFLSTREIARAIDSDNYSVCKNGYLQSYSLCKAIESRFGTNMLINILKCPDTSLEYSFKKYTGTDFSVFYDQWKADVTSRASGKPGNRDSSVHGYLCLDEDVAG